METRASYVAVGAFVLALAVGAIVFVIWLARFQGQLEYAYYDILFPGSVTGLQVDGTVRYRGITVGRVYDIRIDEENTELVRVTIEVQQGTPVKEDSVASLEIQGITGVAYVLLSGGSNDSPRLPETSEAPYPLIASKPSKLEEIFEGAPDLVNKLNTLVERVTLLFSDENQQAIADTLQNIRHVTGTLAESREAMNDVLMSGAAAAEQIRTMSAEFQALASELRQQTRTVSTDAGETMAALQRTADQITQVAAQLDRVIAENRGPIHDFSTTGLYEMTQLMTEFRLLVASLTRVSAQIERDPARFLFGDRQKGFEAQ
jgi:phospholipid/cholesterol/gamma-HCH transport system substrate-binding protein